MSNPDLHPRYYWLNDQIILLHPDGLYYRMGTQTVSYYPSNRENLIPVDKPGPASDPNVVISEADSGEKYIVGVQAMKLGYGSIMPSLQSRTVEWAEATFPNQPTEGKIAHLEDEIKEVRENPNDGEELADCLLLLFNLAGSAGVDLLAEAEKKLAKNKKRVWGKQDERGVVHHVEG